MNKEQLLNTLLISDLNNLSLLDIFITFTLPFFLTIPVALFYRMTSKSNNYSTEFIHSLLLFSSMTAVITLLIGSNIARAFGLVAALSLIRFRSSLKSTLDAMYLFWALTIGMACGTGFYFAGAMVVVLGILYFWIIKYIRIGAPKHLSLLIKATFENAENHHSRASELENYVQNKLRDVECLNVLLNERGQKIYVYSAEANFKEDLEKLKRELKEVAKTDNLEILNSEAALFV